MDYPDLIKSLNDEIKRLKRRCFDLQQEVVAANRRCERWKRSAMRGEYTQQARTDKLSEKHFKNL